MAPNPKTCISAFWTLIGAVLAVAFFIFPEVFDQVVMEAEAFKVGKGSAATALKALDVDNLGVAPLTMQPGNWHYSSLVASTVRIVWVILYES